MSKIYYYNGSGAIRSLPRAELTSSEWDYPVDFEAVYDDMRNDLSINIFGKADLLSKNDDKSQFMLFGQLCFMLSTALLACESEPDAAWEIVQLASKLGHPLDSPHFNELYGLVAPEVACRRIESRKEKGGRR